MVQKKQRGTEGCCFMGTGSDVTGHFRKWMVMMLCLYVNVLRLGPWEGPLAPRWVVWAAPPCCPPPPCHPIHAPGARPGCWPSLSGGARSWAWGLAGTSGLGTGGRAERSSELRAHSRDAAATLSQHSCCPPPVLECPAQTCPGPLTRGASAHGGAWHWGGIPQPAELPS